MHAITINGSAIPQRGPDARTGSQGRGVVQPQPGPRRTAVGDLDGRDMLDTRWPILVTSLPLSG